MSKLTKAETKLHDQACSLLKLDRLDFDQREFVLEHWRPDAEHEVAKAGAFFTPLGLARQVADECRDAQSVIDLCAGIGSLAYHRWRRDQPERLVCVEANPAYIAVGRKVLPVASWVQASVFDLPDLGRFDLAVSNPPYGRIRRNANGPRYRGGLFEYHVIDVASTLAEQGVSLVPQSSSPRKFSDAGRGLRDIDKPSRDYERFQKETGLALDIGLGIDTGMWRDDWKGTRIVVESVRVDFSQQVKQGCQRRKAS